MLPCGGWGKGGGGGAGEEDLAGIGLVGAGHDLDQGGFAGAIFTEECVDLSGVEGDGDPAQGPDGAKRLGDVAEFEDGRGGHGREGMEEEMAFEGNLVSEKAGQMLWGMGDGKDRVFR